MIFDVPEQPIDLRRFIEAQAKDAQKIVSELSQGKKMSHWMWYTFPQIRGLGESSQSTYYAIQSIAHAQEYMQHTGLANRLRFHTKLVLRHKDKDIEAIFSNPDHLKLRSCMTLFSLISKQDTIFEQVIAHFFDGEKDPLTLKILNQQLKHH